MPDLADSMNDTQNTIILLQERVTALEGTNELLLQWVVQLENTTEGNFGLKTSAQCCFSSNDVFHNRNHLLMSLYHSRYTGEGDHIGRDHFPYVPKFVSD